MARVRDSRQQFRERKVKLQVWVEEGEGEWSREDTQHPNPVQTLSNFNRAATISNRPGRVQHCSSPCESCLLANSTYQRVYGQHPLISEQGQSAGAAANRLLSQQVVYWDAHEKKLPVVPKRGSVFLCTRKKPRAKG